MQINAYYAAFVPDENGSIAVWFPDVPGCVTWGENMEHAFAMAMEALEGHLEALANDGDPIPSPSVRDEILAMIRRNFEAEGESPPPGMALQLVPTPDVQEKPARVNVSFRRSTLSMIDKKAADAGMTRSGFLARAAETYSIEPR